MKVRRKYTKEQGSRERPKLSPRDATREQLTHLFSNINYINCHPLMVHIIKHFFFHRGMRETMPLTTHRMHRLKILISLRKYHFMKFLLHGVWVSSSHMTSQHENLEHSQLRHSPADPRQTCTNTSLSPLCPYQKQPDPRVDLAFNSM